MKKRTLINAFFVCMLLPCMMSCEQDPLNWKNKLAYKKDFEAVYTPTAVQTLLSFANNETIDLSITGNDTLKWKASVLPKGSAMVVRYEVLLDSCDNNFNKTDNGLLGVITSGNEGIDTTLVISSSALVSIASNAGFNEGIKTLSWKVRAYCGLDNSISKVTGHFKLSVPASSN
jgi:starch-binding outer membrane protein SusE/F